MNGHPGVDDILGRIWDVADRLPVSLLLWCLAGLVAAIVLYAVYRKFSGRGQTVPQGVNEPGVDVMALGDEDPPPGAPVLEFYNIPARLAVVVLAPAGRLHEAPPEREAGQFLESLLPGLSGVVATHRPRILRWSPQLSTSGFANKVFASCHLPSATVDEASWCGAAGIFKNEGRTFMAALIMRTQRPISQVHKIIETPEEWPGCLRVKGGNA